MIVLFSLNPSFRLYSCTLSLFLFRYCNHEVIATLISQIISADDRPNVAVKAEMSVNKVCLMFVCHR